MKQKDLQAGLVVPGLIDILIDSNFLKLVNIKTYCLIFIFFFSSWAFSQNTKIKQLESQRILIKKEIENINALLFDNSKTTKIAYNDLDGSSAFMSSKLKVIPSTITSGAFPVYDVTPRIITVGFAPGAPLELSLIHI